MELHRTSEAGGRQHVHISVFQLVWSRSLPPALHAGNLHFGRSHLLDGGVVGQPRGLRLHHLHGAGLLSATVRLQSVACWDKTRWGDVIRPFSTQQRVILS